MAALREGPHNLRISSGDTTEEVPPVLPSQDSQEMENPPVEEPQQPKRKRGETKMKTIAMDPANRVVIQFNDKGQAIGEASVGLSSFLGALVREIVPLTIDDWRRVPEDMRSVLWASIQQRYALGAGYQKDYVFQEMGRLWRASKSRMVSKIREKPNAIERLALKPDNIKSNKDWKAFIAKKTSAEFLEKSNKFKEMRSTQLPHACSRRGYARLADDMKENKDSCPITRTDVWTKAHTKKNGNPVNAAVASTVEKLKQCSRDLPSSSKNNFRLDALSQIFGPECRGQVRGIGFGVNPSKLSVLSQRDDKMSNMEDLIKQLMKNQNEGQANEEDPDIPITFPPIKGPIPGDKCKLLNWTGTGEVVAEGRRSTSDPKQLVHHIPLGPNAVRVWVDVVLKPEAFLWRPTADMTCIQEVMGTTVAWPADHVIMDET